MNRRNLLKNALTYAFLTGFIVVTLFPLYWMMVTAVKPPAEVLTSYRLFPSLADANWGIFPQVLTLGNKPMLNWIKNSAVVTLGSAAASMIIAIFGGYALSRHRRYPEILTSGYTLLAVRLLPPVLLIVPLYVIFAQLRLLNTLHGLMIANVAFILPFAIWMMKSFFDGIPVELDQAAQVDGCNTVQALWRVILPSSLPGLAATGIYCAVFSWTDYLFASVFVRNENFTVTVGVTTYIEEYVINWNGLMAASLVGVIPVVLAFIVLERYLVRGLASGAVKQ